VTKKRAAWLGGVLAIGLLIAGLNANANANARDELDQACGCARASVEQTLNQSSSIFVELFGEDAGEMRAFMRSEVHLLCNELDAELTPFTWNVGRNFSPTPSPERAARATAAIDRARGGCPAIYRRILGAAGGNEQVAEELCNDLFEGMARNDEADPESIAVWRWPSAIQRSMCLDSVRTRATPAPGP